MTALTKKEQLVFDILLQADTALTMTDIRKIQPDLNEHTLPAVLKSLLDKNMIRVSHTVPVGKTVARAYVPVMTRTEYELSKIQSVSPVSAVAYFLEGIKEDEALNQIEAMIEKRRQELEHEQ